MDDSIKIILLLGICFIILFIIKKFVFKIFIVICLFFAILFKDELAERIEQFIDNKKNTKKITLSIMIYRIFDALEYLLLFSATTIAIYKIIFVSNYML